MVSDHYFEHIPFAELSQSWLYENLKAAIHPVTKQSDLSERPQAEIKADLDMRI